MITHDYLWFTRDYPWSLGEIICFNRDFRFLCVVSLICPECSRNFWTFLYCCFFVLPLYLFPHTFPDFPDFMFVIIARFFKTCWLFLKMVFDIPRNVQDDSGFSDVSGVFKIYVWKLELLFSGFSRCVQISDPQTAVPKETQNAQSTDTSLPKN